jgi:hypothetical protein
MPTRSFVLLCAGRSREEAAWLPVGSEFLQVSVSCWLAVLPLELVLNPSEPCKLNTASSSVSSLRSNSQIYLRSFCRFDCPAFLDYFSGSFWMLASMLVVRGMSAGE